MLQFGRLNFPCIQAVLTAVPSLMETNRQMDVENRTGLNRSTLKLLSDASLAAGFISIFISILTWVSRRDEDRAHAERFGIFIGLWVPSLMILSNRLARLSEEVK
jgi:hypothetical protein